MDDQSSPSPAAVESAAERRAKRRAASTAVRLPPIAPGGADAAADAAAPAADGARKGRGRKQRAAAEHEVDPEAEEVARMAAAPLADVQPLPSDILDAGSFRRAPPSPTSPARQQQQHQRGRAPPLEREVAPRSATYTQDASGGFRRVCARGAGRSATSSAATASASGGGGESGAEVPNAAASSAGVASLELSLPSEAMLPADGAVQVRGMRVAVPSPTVR